MRKEESWEEEMSKWASHGCGSADNGSLQTVAYYVYAMQENDRFGFGAGPLS